MIGAMSKSAPTGDADEAAGGSAPSDKKVLDNLLTYLTYLPTQLTHLLNLLTYLITYLLGGAPSDKKVQMPTVAVTSLCEIKFNRKDVKAMNTLMCRRLVSALYQVKPS